MVLKRVCFLHIFGRHSCTSTSCSLFGTTAFVSCCLAGILVYERLGFCLALEDALVQLVQ